MIVWLPKLYNHQLIKPYIKIVSFLLELISITFTNCIVHQPKLNACCVLHAGDMRVKRTTLKEKA